MTPDLASLATALYVKSDDLLKASPHLAPWRPTVGITPKLTWNRSSRCCHCRYWGVRNQPR
ncbi:hypothetical protein CD790_11230 [Streptomyces sp. SAJ15]|nr:hypothetical protein CD790_11230 [Streptomyces sp. SAJ15]